jgi:hypothetical protein
LEGPGIIGLTGWISLWLRAAANSASMSPNVEISCKSVCVALIRSNLPASWSLNASAAVRHTSSDISPFAAFATEAR